MNDTAQRLIGILSKVAKSRRQITLETRLTEELEIDSLEFIALIIRIEKEFRIKFMDRDVDASRFVTVLDVSSYIDSVVARGQLAAAAR